MEDKVASISGNYVPSKAGFTAQALRKYWRSFAPNKGMNLIKAEQRRTIDAAGIPIPVLKAIGDELARAARKDVRGFLPLAQLLWDEHGREGRVIALIVLGAMELVEPEHIVPLLKDLCKRCATWEDADRLAMDALEPIVRKHPERWLDDLEPWLKDKNKWVRRAAITVVARIPMKHPAYAGRCLQLAERMLSDSETDVRRAVSFAIRLCAKADAGLVSAFLKKLVPASDQAAVWVLCDVIRSLDRKLIPQFSTLLPRYQKWSDAPGLSSTDRRSIESAMRALQA